VLWIVIGVVALVALLLGIPWLHEVLTTVSTDDAYVNGHVTLVAPRVSGQVARVLVDDNNRVRKGDLLVQLDKEPFLVQLNVAQSAVDAARSDLVAAQAQVRAAEGQVRSLRFSLDHAIQEVDNQIALLHSKIATLNSKQAAVVRAQSDFDRVDKIRNTGAVSPDEVVERTQALVQAKADTEAALQQVYQVRASLGLPPRPENSDDLGQVPPDLDQTFSTVREAQSKLAQAAAQIGVYDSFNLTPKEMVKHFYERDPSGDIDRIYAQLLKDAPGIKQAESKLGQALRNLDQANLNLKYTGVISEIDGVVTRRNVNPGNNVVAGQSLMAVRSIDEIWVDANFKETQLGDLRIGQPADLDVDLYGSRHRFKGRISGFTFGTGSTLALLPPENATGNFVKVVQRLPVRIEVMDYQPDVAPLFIGLSVTAKVHVNEQPSGPDAGRILQPLSATSQPAAQP
jgi:membrane fusion protein (multidrug efflux system)